MAKFIGFANRLLLEVDFISGITFDPDMPEHPAFEHVPNPTVYFSWKDGTETNYKCTADQWAKLRRILSAQGMILEVS